MASRFVLNQQLARPEQVNEPVVAPQIPDRGFVSGNLAALDAEHIKKLIPKGLLFRALAPGFGPLPRELQGAVADFIPTDRHSSGVCAEERARQGLFDLPNLALETVWLHGI